MMTYLTIQQLKLQGLIEGMIERLTSDEEGQDMIEYALLAALISIVAIAAIILIGPFLNSLFNDVVNGLKTA